MAGLCVFHGPALARYGFPGPHPFGGERLGAFWAEALRRGLDRQVEVAAPADASEEDLTAFHAPAHIARVKGASRGFLDDGDTPAFPGIYEAACTAVGTSLLGMRRILEGGCRRAFNPIGGLHHARRDAAAGFCVFNDIGVVIERLKARHGIRRIGYADIDVHHGDGVFYAYASDPGVVIADIHQDGRTLYPGTGAAHETGLGPARGTKLNLPLRPGSGEAEFLAAFGRAEAFLDAARPEFVILQCGADGLAGDPLGELKLTPGSHRHAAARLRAVAERHAGGRLLALGGGGYDLGNLAAAWCAVVEALA